MGAPFLKSMAHGGASFEIYGPEPAMGAPVLKSTARIGHGGAGAPPTPQNTSDFGRPKTIKFHWFLWDPGPLLRLHPAGIRAGVIRVIRALFPQPQRRP